MKNKSLSTDSAPADYLLGDAFQQVLRSLLPIRLEPGDVLLTQGEPSDAAYYLEAGSVGAYAQTAYGPIPLAILDAPRLIGEIGVLTDLPRTASIKAVSAAVLYRIDRALLRNIGHKTPALLLSVITQLGRQIDAVNKAIGLYTNALSALEKREFDERILEDLRNPPVQLMDFSATFQRLAAQILDKRRKQEELASAAVIQQSLLPNADVGEELRSRIDVCAAMRPAHDVGGDFYDYFMLDSDHIAFAIGDVCGKGLPASLFMAVVVTVLRIAAREEDTVAAAMARANATLCRGNAGSMFATVFFCVLDMRTGVLEYCNCGQSAPLLLSVPSGPVYLTATGIPLGLFEDRPPLMAKVKIGIGESLVLYTDGVTEAMNEHREQFGETRLLEEATTRSRTGAAAMVEAIFLAVDKFSNSIDQTDDITCVVVSPLAKLKTSLQK